MKSILSKAAIVAVLTLSAAPAFAQWTITYKNGPSHTKGGSQCISFTAGNILNFPSSGTWTSSTFPYGGNWVVDGKDLRFYGSYNSNGDFIAHHGVYNASKGTYSGGYDEFASDLTPQDDGTFTMKDTGCTAAKVSPHNSNSPTK
jgi:hypothetical protein